METHKFGKTHTCFIKFSPMLYNIWPKNWNKIKNENAILIDGENEICFNE
jgi:hypothetical protein